jgi:hypothetical protein
MSKEGTPNNQLYNNSQNRTNPGGQFTNNLYTQNPSYTPPFQQAYNPPSAPDIPLNVLNIPPEGLNHPISGQVNYQNNSMSFNRQGSLNRDVGYYELDSSQKQPLFKANTIDFVEPVPRFTPINTLPQSKSFDTPFGNFPNLPLAQNRLNQSTPAMQGNSGKPFKIFDDDKSYLYANKAVPPNSQFNPLAPTNLATSQQFAPNGVSNSHGIYESGVISKFTDQDPRPVDPNNMFMNTNQSINFKDGFL